ncbi:MAG: tetratricopeptide repeat protein [Chloroflexota bacterium]|nr:tetratricopeptide repeat protein [Chloroflexota bacterium]
MHDLSPIRELLAMRDLKKAEVQIAKLLRGTLSGPDSAQLLTLRARARLLAARAEEALDDLAAAEQRTDDPTLRLEIHELQGDAWFARYELASVGFADRLHAQRAEDTYRALITDHPSYPNLGWLHYQLARILLTDGRIQDAITCLTDALLAPSTLPALTAYCFERLGFIYFYEKRDTRRALGFLDKALHTYPGNEAPIWVARLETLRARVLRELGNTDAALAAIDTAIDIAYQTDETRIALADALLTAGELLSRVSGRERDVISRLQQYLQTARKPLGIDVTWSRVYEMLGNAYFNSGQYAAAGEAYQHALQHNPYHPWELSLHYQMARAWYQCAEYDKAVNAMDTLLKTAHLDNQPVTDYRVYDVLGSAHFALKRYHAARQAFDQALALTPSADDREKIIRYRTFAAELGG